jgi:hypothetical protein
MPAMRLNLPRLVLAGLAAGVLAKASGFALVHFFLGPEYVKTLFSHMSHEPGPGTMARHLSVRFIVGFVAAALVFGLGPRLRGRVRTALGAALVIYLIGYVPSAMLLYDFDILVGRNLWITLAWCAGEILLASLLAAAIYRDRRPVRTDTIAAHSNPNPESGTTA